MQKLLTPADLASHKQVMKNTRTNFDVYFQNIQSDCLTPAMVQRANNKYIQYLVDQYADKFNLILFQPKDFAKVGYSSLQNAGGAVYCPISEKSITFLQDLGSKDHKYSKAKLEIAMFNTLLQKGADLTKPSLILNANSLSVSNIYLAKGHAFIILHESVHLEQVFNKFIPDMPNISNLYALEESRILAEECLNQAYTKFKHKYCALFLCSVFTK